jgi:hypothetical protein
MISMEWHRASCSPGANKSLRDDANGRASSGVAGEKFRWSTKFTLTCRLMREGGVTFLRLAVVAAMLTSMPAASQQQQPGQTLPPSLQWEQLPMMQLEQMYRGPLKDTVIQRWRDPALGSVCYIYLPITAAHSDPQPSGYVQYGANYIGSISCVNAVPTSDAPARGRNAPRSATPNRPPQTPEPAR